MNVSIVIDLKEFSGKVPVHPVICVKKEIIKNPEWISEIIAHPASMMDDIRIAHISNIIEFQTRENGQWHLFQTGIFFWLDLPNFTVPP